MVGRQLLLLGVGFPGLGLHCHLALNARQSTLLVSLLVTKKRSTKENEATARLRCKTRIHSAATQVNKDLRG